MDYEDFYKYFYNAYNNVPSTAQMDKQDKTIFHLKMELAKLKKQVRDLSKKGD